MSFIKGTNTVILRADAGPKIGLGHLRRCCALGAQLQQQGFSVVYAVKFGVDEIKTITDQESIVWQIPQTMSWQQEAAFLLERGVAAAHALLWDIATQYAWEDIGAVQEYMCQMKQHCFTVLIDGMGDNALLPKVNASVDIAILPYVGYQQYKYPADRATTILGGPYYFIFGPRYGEGKIQTKTIRDTAQNILVTLGGADPHHTTHKIIEALNDLKDVCLHVRVIIGPHFSQGLCVAIDRSMSAGHHQYQIVTAPTSLYQHIQWADLAIASSGLTKYELAVMQTPAVLLSLNDDYAAVNKPFEQLKSSIHVGVDNDVAKEKLTRTIKELIFDKALRQAMSQAAADSFDAQGAQRIAKMIAQLKKIQMGVLSCRK